MPLWIDSRPCDRQHLARLEAEYVGGVNQGNFSTNRRFRHLRQWKAFLLGLTSQRLTGDVLARKIRRVGRLVPKTPQGGKASG